MKLTWAALGVLCLHVGNTAISGGSKDETIECDLTHQWDESFEKANGFRFAQHPTIVLNRNKKRWQVKVGPILLEKAEASQVGDQLVLRGQNLEETWFVEVDARKAKVTFSAVIPSQSPWVRKVASFRCQ
jgi:hypothetical protein